MATIAIVGAGPGLGLSIARRFGREGFHVGLIARRLEALEDCARQLTAEGIDAAAHSADAGDERQLTAALDSIGRRFGGIDVLEFSPMPFSEMPRYTAAATTVDDVMHHLRVQTPTPSCLRGESCRGCCSAAAAACFSPPGCRQ